jgi:hypothetical protein
LYKDFYAESWLVRDKVFSDISSPLLEIVPRLWLRSLMPENFESYRETLWSWSIDSSSNFCLTPAGLSSRTTSEKLESLLFNVASHLTVHFGDCSIWHLTWTPVSMLWIETWDRLIEILFRNRSRRSNCNQGPCPMSSWFWNECLQSDHCSLFLEMTNGYHCRDLLAQD